MPKFDRLSAYEVLLNGRVAHKSLEECIRYHLYLLLNSRHGSLPHLPDYGLPDFAGVYVYSSESLDHLRQSIRETILRYEPRLENVRVSTMNPSGGEVGPCFRIEAIIKNELSSVVYETRVQETQEVDVQRLVWG